MNTQDAIQLYNEVLAEDAVSAPITFDEYLREINPLPDEAILLGMCDDRLPLLFNTGSYEPSQPLAIQAGEKILRNAYASKHNTVETVVLSNTWKPETGQHSEFYKQTTGDLILSLVSWAYGNTKHNNAVLLLVDGLENMDTLDFEVQQNFRWLLSRGRKRGAFVIASFRKTSQFLESFLVAKHEGGCFVFPEGDHFVRVFAL
jgi:hypothetical protein